MLGRYVVILIFSKQNAPRYFSSFSWVFMVVCGASVNFCAVVSKSLGEFFVIGDHYES